MASSKIKNLHNHNDDTYVIAHYLNSYSVNSDDRYKHIDDLLLFDKNRIKATMGPVDLSIIPYSGMKHSNYIVPEDKENRLDLIALESYGHSKFWWILAYMNNIPDPLDIPKGRILFIPNLEGIRRFPNPLS
jgi:hypothetical protein